MLKNKGIYHNIVWFYSIQHKDLETFKQFINKKENWFNSKMYKHLNFINMDTKV